MALRSHFLVHGVDKKSFWEYTDILILHIASLDDIQNFFDKKEERAVTTKEMLRLLMSAAAFSVIALAGIVLIEKMCPWNNHGPLRLFWLIFCIAAFSVIASGRRFEKWLGCR